METIEQLNISYFDWLRDNTVIRHLNGGWSEITTPFLDRHNDCLQIYIKHGENGYKMTDDGYIISDLRSCGCDIDSPKRQNVLNEMLCDYHVKLNNGKIETFCDKNNFAQRKHNLVQAMLAVNDMFYLASSHITGLFFDDVAGWLDSIKVRYLSKFLLPGKSGFSYHFFGAIPKSDTQPERIIQPINHPDRNAVQKLLFEWNDAKELRDTDSVLFPILNDSEKATHQPIVDAFASYGIACITWSNRKQAEAVLSS
jgi:hypothetical protein